MTTYSNGEPCPETPFESHTLLEDARHAMQTATLSRLRAAERQFAHAYITHENMITAYAHRQYLNHWHVFARKLHDRPNEGI